MAGGRETHALHFDLAFRAWLSMGQSIAAVVASLHAAQLFTAGIKQRNPGAPNGIALLIGDDAAHLAARWYALWIVVASVITRAAQAAATEPAGELALLQRQHAIHEHIFDAFRSPIGIVKSSHVVDLLRIEDRDIGKVILPQQAAVAQMLALRRQGSKFANRCFQRQQVL